jgi:hypothetical protein
MKTAQKWATWTHVVPGEIHLARRTLRHDLKIRGKPLKNEGKILRNLQTKIANNF